MKQKGEHDSRCKSSATKKCLCNTCIHDHFDNHEGKSCCFKHFGAYFECPIPKCEDYQHE